MKQTRQKHRPSFKAKVRPRAKVTLAALMGDQTIAELATRFGVWGGRHPYRTSGAPHPFVPSAKFADERDGGVSI